MRYSFETFQQSALSWVDEIMPGVVGKARQPHDVMYTDPGFLFVGFCPPPSVILPGQLSPSRVKHWVLLGEEG